MSMSFFAKVQESATYLRESLPRVPEVGMILGSGLGGLADRIEDAHCIPYASVPYMVTSTVEGHAGRFVCGMLDGRYVICMQGRLHAYEGYSPREVAFPVFVMKVLGVSTLLVTNASGGINTSFEVGDIMMIVDHINMKGGNPLLGPYEPRLGPRYNDMSHAYTPALQEKMRIAARRCGIPLREGVFLGDLGPSFETPAEIRAFRTLGADAVAMSTIFEVIAAANCGLDVVALSLIANMAAGVLDAPITSEEVNVIGARRAVTLCTLVGEFLHLL